MEEGARLDFNIAPAWYQTIWFRGFYVLAFFTLLWGMYQMRIRQLQEQEERFRDAVETMPALAFAVDLKVQSHRLRTGVGRNTQD